MDRDNNLNITQKFGEGVFLPEAKDALTMIGDTVYSLGLDNILENTLLSNIPIVSLAKALVSTGFAIKDRIFLKKYILFLKEFNLEIVNSEEIDKRRDALQNHEKWVYQEIEWLITYLDNFESEIKSLALGEYYRAFLNKQISLETFHEFVDITRNLLNVDFCYLCKISYLRSIMENPYISRTAEFTSRKNSFNFHYDPTEITLSRLISFGLVEIVSTPSSADFHHGQKFYSFTILGEFISRHLKKLHPDIQSLFPEDLL